MKHTVKLDPKVLDDLHNLQAGLHSAREYQSSDCVTSFQNYMEAFTIFSFYHGE